MTSKNKKSILNLFEKPIPDVSFLETKKSWEELEALQQGYTNKKILENYSAASQDTKIKPSSALIYSSIANIASFAYKNGGKAKVVDFGGGVGNFYYEIKEMFPDLQLDWTVIEQDYIVNHFKKTKSEVEYSTLEQHLNRKDGCDILLLSGVLQFIKDYQSFMPKLINQFKAEEVILDRTFITRKGDTRLCLQYTNKDICYPCYHYNKEELHSFFKDYSLFNEWQSPTMKIHNSRNKFYYGGAAFRLKKG